MRDSYLGLVFETSSFSLHFSVVPKSLEFFLRYRKRASHISKYPKRLKIRVLKFFMLVQGSGMLPPPTAVLPLGLTDFSRSYTRTCKTRGQVVFIGREKEKIKALPAGWFSSAVAPQFLSRGRGFSFVILHQKWVRNPMVEKQKKIERRFGLTRGVWGRR